MKQRTPQGPSSSGKRAGVATMRVWRAKVPVVLVVIACVTAVTAAVTGAAKPVPGLQFLPPGHWVFNVALQSVFHIDGATTNIDAQTAIPGDPGSQVVQGDTSSYVVGRTRISEFGKSNLTVEQTITPPSDEVPVAVEIAGGPYLVYRNAGQVVRLGDPSVTLAAGGVLGDPVATSDGTLWLYRTSSGLLCRLPRGADRISCPVLVPNSHAGALSVVNDRPVFVDTSADTLHTVGESTLGDGKPLGVDAPVTSRLASTDVSGRVAILDAKSNKIHLVDPAPAAKPVTVALPTGDYDGPASTGAVVAVVDRTTDTLLTYDGDGKKKEAKQIPRESGSPRLTRGEDSRVYVDGAEGKHVLVVDRDGEIADVPITSRKRGNNDWKPEAAPPDKPTPPTSTAPPAPPTESQRPEPSAAPAPPTTTAPAPPPVRTPPAAKPPKPKPPAPVPASPPGAPPGVSATADVGSATVTWRPAADNRSPITRYTVSWTASTGQTGSLTVGPGARAATVPGLANGVRYVFTVSATNAAGRGPGASANPVTPVGAAAAPPTLTVLYDAENNSALVSWQAPNMGGGQFVHYLVSVTGLPDDTARGNSLIYARLPAVANLTFTIRAVTRTPGGQLLIGAPASRTVR
ncbi:fibronectin type III domain-containing protein [Actinokineospora sp.]|uniref:fibronectin type III domain-containing protein n=1 Tax=Actinokineospora sp. TaxID=1872133 RepID=UPI004038241B